MGEIITTEEQEKKRISYSQMSCYKRCKKKWHYRYAQKLQPMQSARPLTLGKLIHMGMECYYGDKDYVAGMQEMHAENIQTLSNSNALYDDEKIEYINNEQIYYEDAVEIMHRYVKYDTEDPLLPAGWKVVSLEEEFLVELLTGYDQLYGFIDMVVEDDSGNIWGIEHKSGEQFFDVEQLSLNEQTSLYISVLKTHYGEKVRGMIYNLVRTKKPYSPKVNKNNSLSKSAIDTTWEVYLETILANNLDPADYYDMQMKLENNKFFDRAYIYRTAQELNNFMDETSYIMEDIVNQDPDKCYRTPTRNCAWDCKEFYELCIMESKGLDTSYYKEKAYVTRQSGRDEKVEEESSDTVSE